MPSYVTELVRFYERMVADPFSDMPKEGMSSEKISFALVIDADGNLVSISDLRSEKGKPARMDVPAAVVRSSNPTPNFTWDNTGFVLGIDGKGKPEQTEIKHNRFKEFHRKILSGIDSSEIRAFLAFLDKWEPEMFADLDLAAVMLDANVVFRLNGERRFLHESPVVQEAWQRSREAALEKIALTHPKIKGVAGAQSTGASLISFNCPAFTSYGKEQNASAPMTEKDAKAYTTALNYLLQREHKQTAHIGDTAIVFWAEKPHPFEQSMDMLFDVPVLCDNAPQDEERIKLIRDILSAIQRNESLHGIVPGEGTRFYVLGLAPNAGRLSVRYWLVSTLEELLRHAGKWYADIAIERQRENEPEFPPLWRLLAQSIAVQKESKNVSPKMAGQLAKCVLFGGRFPENVYISILQRIRVDKDVNYFRAALLKAFFCRNRNKQEDWMQTLDKEETNIGYRLGRAFALMEKAQNDALGKVNSGIRERYLSAASTMPASVFPTLVRLSQHHVTKATKEGGKTWYENYYGKNMGEILDGISHFPATLSLDDQGCFFLGYYNQRNDLYRKKNAETTENA